MANNNLILTDEPKVHGLILQDSNVKIEDFASTGRWTLGTKPALNCMLDLIPLSVKLQKMEEEVAAAVYRPCCNNSTLFSDCNHGLAMLDLLERMASQSVTIDQMIETAKYVNAFWFPQHTLDVAIYLQTNYWVDFAHAAPRQVMRRELASVSGFKMVHQSLVRSGEVKPALSQGIGCSNCCGTKKHLSRGAFFSNLLTIFSI